MPVLAKRLGMTDRDDVPVVSARSYEKSTIGSANGKAICKGAPQDMSRNWTVADSLLVRRKSVAPPEVMHVLGFSVDRAFFSSDVTGVVLCRNVTWRGATRSPDRP